MSEALNDSMRCPFIDPALVDAWRKGAGAALWAVNVALGQTDYADNCIMDAEEWLGLADEDEEV